MEKILTIDGRQVKFKSTAAFLLRYKAQFRRDALRDVLAMQGVVGADGEIGDLSSLDMEVIFNLIWVLAKTADPSIPPPLEWLDTFGEFPLNEIAPELIEMMISSLGSTTDFKKK